MLSPTDAIISSPSQISSLPGELLGSSSGPLSSQAKQDQLSTISSPQPKHCAQFGPGCSVAQALMSPLLSPGAQDSLPLSPSLGRDHLGPLSPTESPQLGLAAASPIPSQQEAWEETTTDKSEEAVAGPSNSSQDCWSPDSEQAKQGRKFRSGIYEVGHVVLGYFHHL